MKLARFLNKPASELLSDPTFKDWPVQRSVERELSRVYYVFPKNGMELCCDRKEVINTIFLYATKYGGVDESIAEHSFSQDRDSIRAEFGPPPSSAEERVSQYLGRSGAWDRYEYPDYCLHFTYMENCESIETITLMTTDAID